MHGPMVAVGAGAMIAWGALPLLSRLAARRTEDPQLRQRALTFSLLLSNALFLAPWIRIVWPGVLARFTPLHALLLPTPALLHADAVCCLAEAIGYLWLISALLTGTRTLTQLARLRRCARTGQPAPSEVAERVHVAAADMRIDPPAVVMVNGSDVPFITGVLEPVLALPISLLHRLRPAAMDLVIRHELVHLARKDVLWNAIVAGACVPFGWHPSARRVMQEIVLAREEAVDSTVGSTSPCTYARVLVDVAAGVSRRPQVWTLGIEPSSLERRIARLLEPPVEVRAAVWHMFALASVLFVAALVSPRFGLRPLSIYGGSEIRATRTSAEGPGVSLSGIRRDCPKNEAGGCPHPGP